MLSFKNNFEEYIKEVASLSHIKFLFIILALSLFCNLSIHLFANCSKNSIIAIIKILNVVILCCQSIKKNVSSIFLCKTIAHI